MSTAEVFQRGRLWSLWDIVHKVEFVGLYLRITQEFSVLGQLLMDALAMPNGLASDPAFKLPSKKFRSYQRKGKISKRYR